MVLGCWRFAMIAGLLEVSEGRPTTQREAPRGGSRPGLQALAAAAKKKQPETHDAPHASRAPSDAGRRISMRDPGSKWGKTCAIPLRHGAYGSLSRYFTNH